MKKILLSFVIAFSMLASLAQPTAGLVAYWPMNGNFTDAGPNAIHGSNVGATATTNYAGAANAAMNFNNPVSTVAQYATHPVNANLNFAAGQNFTIVFSVYANSPFVHNGGFYDNNLNYGGPGVWFWNSPGYPAIHFNYRNGSVGTTSGAFPVGVWKHVCAVRNAGTISIYINGVLNNSASEGTMTPVYTYPARFGTMFFNGMTPPQYNGLHGKLDEFRIYNRALTLAEIQGMAGGALPVKLTSFTASEKNNTVSLKWQTQYEQNSSHYNIQRSTDGLNFTDVARVAAAGNSNLPLNYSYNDLLPASVQLQKTVFYRLQSVDVDGKFAYSQVLALQLDAKEMQLLVYPNPAKEILQIQTGNCPAGEAALVISDAAGRQLYRRVVVLQPGNNSLPVNVSMLTKGAYIIRLIKGEEVHTRQFIKD
jgi:hypothetical protein